MPRGLREYLLKGDVGSQSWDLRRVPFAHQAVKCCVYGARHLHGSTLDAGLRMRDWFSAFSNGGRRFI